MGKSRKKAGNVSFHQEPLRGGHEGNTHAELTDGENVLLFFGDSAVLQQQRSNGLEKIQRGGSAHSLSELQCSEPTELTECPLKSLCVLRFNLGFSVPFCHAKTAIKFASLHSKSNKDKLFNILLPKGGLRALQEVKNSVCG